MNPVRWMRLRLRAIAGRRALERDMQEEMRLHLEQAAARYEARGMSPSEARVAAVREFGNIGALQEHARDVRGSRWIEELGADLRFAFRYFGRKKLVAITVVAVLALGIGVNTGLFTFLRAVYFRPAPAVPDDPSRIRVHGYEQLGRGAAWERRDFSYVEFRALAERKEAFRDLAAWVSHDVVLNPGDSIGARGVDAQFVTANFFAALGVPVLSGPGFERQAPDGLDMAAVMSHRSAVELFGSPESATGRIVLVNEVPLRIVGVAPPRFQGAVPMGRTALWIPLSARAEIARLPREWLADSAALAVFGRLGATVSEEQATAIARHGLARLLPDSAARVGMSRLAYVVGLRARPPINDNDMLLGFAGMGSIGLLILLVACTNVSSMMVAAAVGRRHEIAVRLSLGATRWRLIRQLVTESALLAIAGGALGLMLYWWFAKWVISRHTHMTQYNTTPDVATLAFMCSIALGTGILFGLSPALHAIRSGVAGALRDSGSGASHRSRLQRVFVTAQIVFSQPLLVLLAVLLAEARFDRDPLPRALSERVVAAGFQRLEESGTEAERREEVASLIPRIAAHPEVAAVAPDANEFTVRSIAVPVPGDSAKVARSIYVEGAAPGYLALLDVPIILGRDVALADTLVDTLTIDYPIVIGSDLAQTLWGEANPIGRTLPSPPLNGSAQGSIRMTIVGVYDAAHPLTRGEIVPRVYTAHGKHWREDVLLVRTRGSAERFVPELRRLIRAEAPNVPIGRMETLAGIDDGERKAALSLAAVVAGAGGLALLLASLGLYGVVSLAVQQRRREIGIRIAVGALPARVTRMFLASGVRVSAIGLALGLPLTFGGLRLLMSLGLVPELDINSWPVGVSIAVMLLLVATAATWVPARRAAQVDPARTLRVE